jgi:hypothetical protein
MKDVLREFSPFMLKDHLAYLKNLTPDEQETISLIIKVIFSFFIQRISNQTFGTTQAYSHLVLLDSHVRMMFDFRLVENFLA